MSAIQGVVGVCATIVIFLYGLEGFSRELRAISGDRMQVALATLTKRRTSALLTGAVATAIIQSSSAVTSMTVAFVEAGTLSFLGALPILLGANIGTTVTAWLVTFKLSGLGPLFVVIGAAIGWLPFAIRVLGKATFYFGFILFALDLVNAALAPVKSSPVLLEVLAYADTPVLGVLIGAVLTAIIQSSSVTSGLAILLVQQQVLPPEAAIDIVIGANVGSSSTALLAAVRMGRVARRVARANALFNLMGVVVIFPFIPSLSRFLIANSPPAQAVAWAHLTFNVLMALLFMLLLWRFDRRIAAWLAARDASRDAATPPEVADGSAPT